MLLGGMLVRTELAVMPNKYRPSMCRMQMVMTTAFYRLMVLDEVLLTMRW